MKRILIIAYYFPPDENGGTERVKHFYLRLREQGYDTYVLTAKKRREKRPVNSKADKHVYRLWSIWGLIRAYDGFIRKHKLKIGFFNAIARFQIHIFSKKVKPDVCLASFPLSYDFDIGLLIQKYSKCKLIADFRDGLLFQPFNIVAEGNAIYKDKMSKLESDIVATSDMILTVSPEHAQYFMEKYGHSAFVIPNGYDHTQIINCSPLDIKQYEFTVLYTGGLDSSRPGQFEYVKSFLNKVLIENEEITFVFVGTYKDYEIDFLNRYKNTVVYPKQKREVVIATQRIADVLLLVTGDDEAGTSGKLFEYLFAYAPIINVGIINNAARIIKDCNAGTTIDSQNSNFFKEYIRMIKEGNVDVTRKNIAQYTRESQCKRLAELIASIT